MTGKELIERGFPTDVPKKLMDIMQPVSSNEAMLTQLKKHLVSEAGLKGIAEMEELLGFIDALELKSQVKFDVSLARGLSYYTGAIFEVSACDVAMGSICGGGRYDDLTGIFGLPGVSGVGVSFGADRIYDVMMELNLFPEKISRTADILLINFSEDSAASLMKMAKKLRENGIACVVYPEAAKMKKDVSDPAVSTKVNDLLWNMITVSDNESFNELVRLQTTSGVFKDGAEAVNAFLAESQFADTSVQHTLSPSASKDAGLGGRNTTSVKDCGELLSRIYKGECVSKEASEAMLNLLLNQQVTTKIPSGISASVEIANKTGETDTDQHDIAIVYGEKTTYILCVMSENCKSGDAVSHIRDISGIVYNYLNMRLDQD